MKLNGTFCNRSQDKIKLTGNEPSPYQLFQDPVIGLLCDQGVVSAGKIKFVSEGHRLKCNVGDKVRVRRNLNVTSFSSFHNRSLHKCQESSPAPKKPADYARELWTRQYCK